MTAISSSNSAGLRIVSWQVQIPKIGDIWDMKRLEEELPSNTVWGQISTAEYNYGKVDWHLVIGENPSIETVDDHIIIFNNAKHSTSNSLTQESPSIGAQLLIGQKVIFEGFLEKPHSISSFKFASDDPSFDDYDVNDKDRKRNDFFKYDKDDMPAIDALDDQQIYHTDLMYLEDTQRPQKERDAFDWTGRENLQFGFGSLKFAWQMQAPMTSDIVKIPEEDELGVSFKNPTIPGLYLVMSVTNNGNHVDAIRVYSIEEADAIVGNNFITFDTSAGYAGEFNWEIVERKRYSEEQWNNAVDAYEKHIVDKPRTHFTQYIGSKTSEWFNYRSKLAWKIHEPTVGMFVEVINKIVKGRAVMIIEEGTQGVITKLLDKHDLVQVLISDDSIEIEAVGYNILLDKDTFFEYFKEIDDNEVTSTITSSLKFSEEYFDSSPAESNPIEESKLVNPIDDKHLRRTNPKRFDERHDRYTESPDSDISNKYDNAIQGDASLKFSWQIQEEEIIYVLYDTETGELLVKGNSDHIVQEWWAILKNGNDVGGHVLDISNPGNPHIYENETGEIKFMAPTEESLKTKWINYLLYHEEEGGYGFATYEKWKEEVNTPPPHTAQKLSCQNTPIQESSSNSTGLKIFSWAKVG